jgi:hypothetical protein
MLNRRFETSQPHTLDRLVCSRGKSVFHFLLLVSVDQFSDRFLNLNSSASFLVDRFRILPGFSSSSDPISHCGLDIVLESSSQQTADIPLTIHIFTVKSVAFAVIDVFSR